MGRRPRPAVHGGHRLRPLADAEDDAAHQARADQAHGQSRDHVGRDRRSRRGQGRAQGGRRLPLRPQEVQASRRPGAQGRPPARPARHGQDAAGQGRRARVRRAVLLPVGFELRRDVRRARSRAHPPPVRRGAQARARDPLHRRARRRGRPPWLGQQLRARADAQPAPGRDGRLLGFGERHRHRGLQPARQARSRPAATGPLRPSGVRDPARRRGPPEGPRGAHPRQAAGSRRRPAARRGTDQRLDGRGPREHLQRGRDLLRPPRRRGDRSRRLRGRPGAGRRGGAVIHDAQPARAPGRRLPRGRPRAVPRAAGHHRPRAQDLDRAPRFGARVRHEPPRRGFLPEDARGARSTR